MLKAYEELKVPLDRKESDMVQKGLEKVLNTYRDELYKLGITLKTKCEFEAYRANYMQKECETCY